MTPVLVSCQGAILNTRFVSVEGAWGGLVRVPFQSTALHHCLGIEAEQLQLAGAESGWDIKENII